MHKLNKHSKNQSRQRGLTLIELLVALALGVVLVGGISRVYLENKRNYVQDEELARLQENGRFILNILKRELKMVGFFASVRTDIPPNNINVIADDCRTGWALNTDKPLDFFNSTNDVSLSVTGDSFAGCIKNPASIQPNTDIVSIKRSAGMSTIDNAIYSDTKTATGGMKRESFYLRLTGGLNPVYEYVGAAFPAAVLTPETNPASALSMWLYHAKLFYVRNYSVVAGDNIPTLMMVSLQGQAMIESPLIEGVEAFHIEFGIPTATSDKAPVRFVINPTDAQISATTVARVYLLMRTRNPIRNYTDNKTYKLGSLPPVKPGGPYIRRVFTTTIKIRNDLE
jgi:type IV pilus assembly protein PilW